MSKLNRMKNKSVVTKEIIERAFNSCNHRKEDTGISLCNKLNTSCKYAINNGSCEMLQQLSKSRKKVAI